MSNKKYSRVYIEITNICNKNCSFCPGTVREPKRMTEEEFCYVAKSLVGLTDYLYFHVMGEPLTHPNLRALIEYATSLGFKCAITTNGSLLDRVGESILDSGLYKMNISVHSFEGGTEESYQSYINSIASYANKSSEAGILTVLRLWNKGHDGGLNDSTLEILQSALDGEWKWGSRGARIRHKLHLEYGDRFDWPDMEAENMGNSVFCYGLGDHFGILCDGRVIPCCLDREGAITLGNIFEEDINEILSSDRAEAIREGFKQRCAVEELCQKCGYARRFG